MFFRRFINDNLKLFDEINKCVYALSSHEVIPLSDLAITYYDKSTGEIIEDISILPPDFNMDNLGIRKPVFELSGIEADDNVPYVYADLRDGREYCNLLAYNTAIKNKFEVKNLSKSSIAQVCKDLNVLANLSCVELSAEDEGGNIHWSFGEIIDLHDIHATADPEDTQPVIHYTEENDYSPFIDLGQLSGKNIFENALPLSVDRQNPDTLGISQQQLTEIINDLDVYMNGKYSSLFNKQFELITKGRSVTTDYVKDLMNFYATNVRVDNYYDASRLYEDDVIVDVFKTTTAVSADADGDPIIDEKTGNEVTYSVDESFFNIYGNVVDVYSDEYIKELSAVDATRAGKLIVERNGGRPVPYDYQFEALINEFNKSLTKSKFIQYVNKIRKLDAFKEIEEYLEKSPTTAALNTKFTQDEIEKSLVYSEIRDVDDTIQQYFKIKASPYVFTYALSSIDEYKTDEDVVAPNTIMIADMTRSRYVRAADINETECIGIIPIITTAANALIAQNFIEAGEMDPGISYSVY